MMNRTVCPYCERMSLHTWEALSHVEQHVMLQRPSPDDPSREHRQAEHRWCKNCWAEVCQKGVLDLG